MKHNILSRISALFLILLLCFSFASCEIIIQFEDDSSSRCSVSEKSSSTFTLPDGYVMAGAGEKINLSTIPAYTGNAYIAINDNQPTFKENELTNVSFEYYSPLDLYGRCGYTVACVGQDIMPTEARGSIGTVKPTGWQTYKYDFVDGKYLYNRCHLIGFQLTGENANKQNLITGTRYLNIDGMLDFENMIADYVKETGNHVLYRVEPIFDGKNLVATGVHMEGYSVEDGGEGVCFNVFSYNVQPGVEIDYATGESWLSGSKPSESQSESASESEEIMTYILNTSTEKFHKIDCSFAPAVTSKNRLMYEGTREDLITDGYSPCGSCKP